MDNLKIGLFGFGCVGQGLYDIIQEQNLPIDVVAICVKDRDKARPIAADHFTYNPQELLQHPEIQVIVELIDDAEVALSIIKQALLTGKKVVTANKHMVAQHLEELLLLENEHNTLRYEAAVCGSIPIVNTLDSFYNLEPLERISGVFNGSSNFILTKIEKEGLNYPQALNLAQELGFAESNPGLDVGGLDSLNKLVILMAHGFGVMTTPHSLLNLGIQNLSEEDLTFAQDRGLRIKLLANALVIGDQVNAYVMPSFVDSKSPLWNIENEYNAITVKGRYSDTHLYTGKGAGSHPTATSVLSDIRNIAKGLGYEYGKVTTTNVLTIENQFTLPVYLRYHHPRQLDEFQFEKVWSEGKYKRGGMVLGTISLSQLWSMQSFIETQNIFIVDASAVQQTVRQSPEIEATEVVY